MIELKSITKPVVSALETRRRVAPEKRSERRGSTGSEPDAQSRAEKAFIVVGKSQQPVRRQIQTSGPFETVIGLDSRVRVLETEITPWRMIIALVMSAPSGGAAFGTGWLAGPRTIVTAGHCVHDMRFFGGWADSIEVSAGRNGRTFPFGTIRATRFSSVDKWINSTDPDFDIGCIHLDEPLGDRVGWFAIASLPPTDLVTYMVNISGYPGDRGDGTEQYHSANRILNVGERRIFYDVDTFGGQSGAPVWIHETDGAPPLVVGIHAYGTGGTPFDLGITANSAPRIVPEVFNQIAAWVDADNAAAGESPSA
jgi:glutamyl endopeptidase